MKQNIEKWQNEKVLFMKPIELISKLFEKEIKCTSPYCLMVKE